MSNSQHTEESGAHTESCLLSAENVIKYFDAEQGILDRILGNERKVHAVDGVSLSIDRQETIGIVGESGCGKSTLGRTLARVYEPTDGTIRFDEEDITNTTGKRLKQLRKKIQIIFQDPLSSLNPRKTAGEIIGRPLEVHDLASGTEKDERVAELLNEVGLDPGYAERYPHEFSGGQRQRIGIARALAVEPKLIVADEPVSALDVSVQAQIINLMKRLQREYDLAYVFIAHDLSVVKHVSDRIGVMYLGKIVEEGPTEAIFGNPQHPYTRSLLNAIPRVDDVKERSPLLEGNPPSPIDPPSGCRFHTRCPEYIGTDCEETEPVLMSVGEATGTTQPPIGPNIDNSAEEHDGTHRVSCHWMEEDARVRREQTPYAND